MAEWKRDGRFVYELNEQGFNKWCAIVQAPHTSEDELEAIAKLIAAAPDLLNACRVSMGHFTGGLDGDWSCCDPIQVLRNAISKAEGK